MGGAAACTGRYKGVPAVRPGLVAGKWCYGVMEFGMSCSIKTKKLDAICRNVLWSYVVFFNLVGQE